MDAHNEQGNAGVEFDGSRPGMVGIMLTWANGAAGHVNVNFSVAEAEAALAAFQTALGEARKSGEGELE